MKSKLYGSLTADIVDSTSLSIHDMKCLYSDLSSFMIRLDSLIGPAWGRIVRGDTVECVTENPNSILRIALAMKCYFKYWFSTVASSEASKDFALRYSIGIGTMREVDIQTGFLDGPAIYMSGRNLDNMPRNFYASFDAESFNDYFVESLDLNLKLLDNLINDLSAKQAIVIYYKLIHIPEVVIAEKLGLSQPGVNIRAKLSHWGLISRSLEHFENIKFEEYVR